MSNPAVSSLADDPRLLNIASGILGCAAVPFRATLFDKSPESNWLIPWHQDTALPLVARLDAPGWGPWSSKSGVLYSHAPSWALSQVVALRFHLDASSSDNGPLRVLPGSHSSGVLTDTQVFDTVKQNETVECLVSRGGVVAMRPLLIHSSSKVQGLQQRRVLHIEYAQTLELRDGLRIAVV
jgi:ectoine hydroxylase-related dioxygenase (phytanoyl-CoA dioxygenase family)